MQGKRILICCNRTLGIGGIEKALTTFMQTFDTAGNDVTLVLHDCRGALFPQLPKDNLNVFYSDSICAAKLLISDIKQLHIREVAKGLYHRAMLRLNRNWYAQIMHTYRILQPELRFPGHFDCAISFTTDYSDLSMVLDTDADKRVAFVHADASTNPYIAKLNDKLLQRMDKIYCVSQCAGRQFLSFHPNCAGAVELFHNIVDSAEIRRLGDAPADGMLLDGTPILCTVGRLSPEKGQQLIPRAAARLRKAGCAFRWYLVGEGSTRRRLEREIKALDLRDHVILLGAKTNPYPYMKHCDVYIQPSYTEASCTTLREAGLFPCVRVATDFENAFEEIADGVSGMIAHKNPRDLAEKIRSALSAALPTAPAADDALPSGREEMQKLYDYIEGVAR